MDVDTRHPEHLRRRLPRIHIDELLCIGQRGWPTRLVADASALEGL
ncbi:hypothetical protein ACFPRL_35760 [Pseudoclavibacter helvolus]